MNAQVLTINGGSSSLKFALFERADAPRRVLSGEIERIGLKGTLLRAADPEGGATRKEPVEAVDIEQAGRALLAWLRRHVDLSSLTSSGHRFVHGGSRHTRPQRITPDLIADLRRIAPIDPDHVPGEIALAEVFVREFPRVPQVACFDTTFFRDMPRVAQLFALPRHYAEEGIRRFGFHGLSYTYLLRELTRLAGTEVARGRLVLAHLGAGSSMAAVHNGACVDTTMALTPTAGLVMGTRSGDLDPGLLIYCMRQGMTADQIDDLVNRRSGLLGLSDISSDMKDLLDREKTDRQAAEAIEVYCYQAAKYAAAMAVATAGLDTLVFSAGIGERSAPIRARICARLQHLGIRLDTERNERAAPVISAGDSAVTVRVMETDEESTMAEETLRVIGAPSDEGRV